MHWYDWLLCHLSLTGIMLSYSLGLVFQMNWQVQIYTQWPRVTIDSNIFILTWEMCRSFVCKGLCGRSKKLHTSLESPLRIQRKPENRLKAKQDSGVNPCLLSSNKFRPCPSTYITTRKRQEEVVLMCEWLWILTRAIKSEPFSWTNGANSLRTTSLPSNKLEMSQNCQGCK